MPKRQLFEEDAEQPSASILIATGGGADRRRAGARDPQPGGRRGAGAEGRAGQHHRPAGRAAGREGDGAGGRRGRRGAQPGGGAHPPHGEGHGGGRGRPRPRPGAGLRRPGHEPRSPPSSEKFDPDGQVVRSTETSDEKSNDSKAGANSAGAATASQNVPGSGPNRPQAGPATAPTPASRTRPPTMRSARPPPPRCSQPGGVKRLSVAVAVDGATAPGKGRQARRLHAPARPRRCSILSSSCARRWASTPAAATR